MQIAYLQQNLRPQVVSINVLPSGVALQKQPYLQSGTLSLSASSGEAGALNSPRERGKDKQSIPPRQMLEPGAQSFTWKATDDNEDTLEYSLYFKGEGESDWKLLEKSLSDTFYTLDAAALPDGVYTLKVLASDKPSNPFGKFLVGELISKPFVISNSSPVLEVTGQKVQGKRVEIQFRARVLAGRVESGEFSVDGGEWFLLSPVDGICDSPAGGFPVCDSRPRSGRTRDRPAGQRCHRQHGNGQGRSQDPLRRSAISDQLSVISHHPKPGQHPAQGHGVFRFHHRISTPHLRRQPVSPACRLKISGERP